MSLNDLRRERNRSDYDLARPLSRTIMQKQIPIAAWVIQVIETAAHEPTRTQITDAMKTYERDVLHDVTWHP